MTPAFLRPCLFLLLAAPFTVTAEIKINVAHNSNDSATKEFKFKNLPSPSKTDGATSAAFYIVDGVRDENGGGLSKLHDGKLPSSEDAPAENFFFDANTSGGSIVVDLGSAKTVQQVNSYSWHPGTRGPQVYKLYGADGTASAFDPKARPTTNPEKTGWKFLAKVDTRPPNGEMGDQYAVSISDSEKKSIGSFRYLLFAISSTESDDPFGNTFYSEIDVVTESDTNAAPLANNEPAADAFVTNTANGSCAIRIDTSGAPELKSWAEQKLAPVLVEWYPKLGSMLASADFHPPKDFSITIRPGDGVAATGGTRITANSTWLKRELDREAVGALLHEEVHVMQQYRRPRRDEGSTTPRTRPPGWLVEGIPDYIRWFLYEPQSHGADIQWLRQRRNVTLNYDARYRITANFLDYVITRYDKDKSLLTKINAACREGKYSDDLWKTYTGKDLTELNAEWKADVQKQLASPTPS